MREGVTTLTFKIRVQKLFVHVHYTLGLLTYFDGAFLEVFEQGFSEKFPKTPWRTPHILFQ